MGRKGIEPVIMAVVIFASISTVIALGVLQGQMKFGSQIGGDVQATQALDKLKKKADMACDGETQSGYIEIPDGYKIQITDKIELVGGESTQSKQVACDIAEGMTYETSTTFSIQKKNDGLEFSR